MRFVKLTLAYDGTRYTGWQVQPTEPTIQQALERAIEAVTGQATACVASGRTDSGVHALGQVVSLATASELPPDTLLRAINANLPRDIAVLDVVEAPEGFHAIRDARGKRYRYVIHNSRVRDVFSLNRAWHVVEPLDVAAMRQAAERLLGRHDFASFQAAGSERATTVRHVRRLTLQAEPLVSSGESAGQTIVLEIEADGFLYNMVRNIVGTLVEVGRGAQPTEWVSKVLAALDRKVAGPTAPPQGLYLVEVDYDF